LKISEFNNRWVEIERTDMEADPNNIKLRDRALEIHEADKISFGEALRRARAERGPQFTEGGTPVDPRSIEILRRTREIVEAHPSIRFGEALRQARLEIEA
jgi:hypothetical protein